MYFLIEATIALSASFIINLFVMAVFGQAFYQQTNEEAVSHTVPMCPHPIGPQHYPGIQVTGSHLPESLLDSGL